MFFLKVLNFILAVQVVGGLPSVLGFVLVPCDTTGDVKQRATTFIIGKLTLPFDQILSLSFLSSLVQNLLDLIDLTITTVIRHCILNYLSSE